MQNRTYRTPLVLFFLVLAAVVLPDRNNLAQRLIMQETQKVQSKGQGASSPGEQILITAGRKIVFLNRISKAILSESSGLHGAYCVAALATGGFLVGEGKSIARLDQDGKVLSRASASFKITTDVKPLESGRMLVSDGPAGTVTEMDWSGNITWSVTGLHWPSEAQHLENGNTLVADGTAALKEFDSNGKLVGTTRLRAWAGAVQKVSDGYTLVGESDGVELLDGAGQAVWSQRIPSRVSGVQQLPTGEYLISEPDASRIAILDVNGNVTWELTGLLRPWRALYVR